MKKWTAVLLLLTSFCFIHADFDFARFLFEENDYYRCITELKRTLYSGESDDTFKIENLIGVCYLNMGKFEEADIYFKRNSGKAFSDRNHALILFLKGDFPRLSAESAGDSGAAEEIIRLGRLFDGKYSQSDKPENLDPESEEIFNGYFGIGRKNPFLALLMSAVLPGTGRIYSGRKADALFSITTILLPAAAAVYYKYINDYKAGFIISAAVTGAFYIGELYGAYNSAAIYRPAHIKEYHEKVINSDYSVLSPVFEF